MLETVILWLIIVVAAIYCGRSIYRTLSGKSKGCCGGCDCSAEETSPPLQQSLPDLTGNRKNKKEN
jgi:hypothetical protein